MNRRIIAFHLIFALFIMIVSCNGDTYQPKPKGYFRLDFPEKSYHNYEGECPYDFQYPDYANIVPYKNGNEYCWFNMEFPGQRAKIHFSYISLNNDLSHHIEDSRKLVYKHTVKANDIEENLFMSDEKQVYAMRYDIFGNTASSIQFFITDSVNHFLRGALYFSSLPNSDSLGPSIDFIGSDINHFIETFNWKNVESTID